MTYKNLQITIYSLICVLTVGIRHQALTILGVGYGDYVFKIYFLSP